jgi:hypothetical protein
MRYLIIIPIASLCTFLIFAVLSSFLGDKSTGLSHKEINQFWENKPKSSVVEYVEPKATIDLSKIKVIDGCFDGPKPIMHYFELLEPEEQSPINYSPLIEVGIK